MFDKILGKLPPVLGDLFIEGQLVVAGGSLLRSIVGAPESDIDLFCTYPGVHNTIKEMLGEYETPNHKHPSSGEMWDANQHSRWYKIGDVLLDVVPWREQLGRLVGSKYVDRLLADFDINVSQFATNFIDLFTTEAALTGLATRQMTVIRETPTTQDRLEKYCGFTGFMLPPKPETRRVSVEELEQDFMVGDFSF